MTCCMYLILILVDTPTKLIRAHVHDMSCSGQDKVSKLVIIPCCTAAPLRGGPNAWAGDRERAA